MSNEFTKYLPTRNGNSMIVAFGAREVKSIYIGAGLRRALPMERCDLYVGPGGLRAIAPGDTASLHRSGTVVCAPFIRDHCASACGNKFLAEVRDGMIVFDITKPLEGGTT